jgi:hypothetical protein
MIEEAPLQLYHSALLFTPLRSMIRRIFGDKMPPWLIQVPAASDEW